MIQETANNVELIQEEPGVRRTQTGRIVETGWPHISPSQWPLAHRELGRKVAQQIKFELNLREKAPIHQIYGHYSLGTIRFNLEDLTLVGATREVLNAKLDEQSGENKVVICDIGGGNGRFLRRALLEYASPYGDKHEKLGQLETTLTTLVHHDRENLRDPDQAIGQIKTMAIELPPVNFYAKFDIIIAQNSVFFWTDNPELALHNLHGMLAEDGVALITIPPLPKLCGEEEVDIFELITTSTLFTTTEIIRNERLIGLHLRKN